MVVTATKTEVSVEKITKSVNVITKKDFDDAKEAYLPEFLDNLPGVFVKRNGSAGQFTTVSVRGIPSSYTQFQFNGIPLNDSASTQGDASFFIEDMYIPSNISRVEVLKGTGSSLYGSRAIGGVINILPGKSSQGIHGELSTEYGGKKQFTVKGGVSYGAGDFYINLNPTYVWSEGTTKEGVDDTQFYKNLGLSAMMGYDFGKIQVDLATLNYKTDLGLGTTPNLDAALKLVPGGDPVDDKHREGLLSTTGLKVAHRVFDNWDYELKGSYTNTDRHYFWGANSNNKSYFDGEDFIFDMQHNVAVNDFILLSLGADHQIQKLVDKSPTDAKGPDGFPNTGDEDWTVHVHDVKYHTSDVYGLLQVSFLDDMVNLNLGGRFVMPEKFDNQFVYDASSALSLKDLGVKIHAAISSGYRMPSLYELYGGYLSSGVFVVIGDENLEPEKSINYEAGVEYDVLNIAKTGLTFFYTDFEDKLIYNGAISKYDQAGGEAFSKGFEAFFNARFSSLAKFNLAYTFLKAQYKATKADDFEDAAYTPKHKLTATLTVYPIKNLTTFIRASYRSALNFTLRDPSWTSHDYEEDGVISFDCNVAYKVVEYVDLWLRCENLLGKDYTEGGYQMPGREIYGGLKLSI